MKVTLKVALPRDVCTYFFCKRERMRLSSFSSLILMRGSAAKERASCLSSFACLPSLINLQGRRKLRVRWRCWREPGRGCWINIYGDEDEIRDIQAAAKVPSKTKQKHGVRFVFNLFRLPRTRALNFHHSLLPSTLFALHLLLGGTTEGPWSHAIYYRSSFFFFFRITLGEQDAKCHN